MRRAEMRVPYTHEQEAGFKQQFAMRRKRQVILAIPLVLAIVGVVAAGDSLDRGLFGLPPAVLTGGFLLLVAGALIFSFRNWRCPACDRYLGKHLGPSFCAKCGVRLQ